MSLFPYEAVGLNRLECFFFSPFSLAHFPVSYPLFTKRQGSVFFLCWISHVSSLGQGLPYVLFSVKDHAHWWYNNKKGHIFPQVVGNQSHIICIQEEYWQCSYYLIQENCPQQQNKIAHKTNKRAILWKEMKYIAQLPRKHTTSLRVSSGTAMRHIHYKIWDNLDISQLNNFPSRISVLVSWFMSTLRNDSSEVFIFQLFSTNFG